MEQNYFNSTWTQPDDFASSVHEYTQRSTLDHSYERPYALSMGFERFGQGPPDSGATQDAMQQVSEFYVPPAPSTTNISAGGPRLPGYGFPTPGNHAHTSDTVGLAHNLYGPNDLDSLHELQQVPNIKQVLPLPCHTSSLFGPHYAVDEADCGLPNTKDNSSSELDLPRDSSDEALQEFLFPELWAQLSHYRSHITANSSSTSPRPVTTSDPFTERDYQDFSMQPTPGVSNLGGAHQIGGHASRGGEIMIEEINAEGVKTRVGFDELSTTRSTASYTGSPSSISASPFSQSTPISASTSTFTSPESSSSPSTYTPLHLPTAQTIDGRYLCPCGASIKRELDFIRHVQTVHACDNPNGEAAIVCDHEGCGTTFSRTDALQRHVKEGKHGKLPRGKAKAKQMERMRGGVDYVVRF